MPVPSAWKLGLLLGFVMGCSNVDALPWTIQFESATFAWQRIDAEIRRDDCDGELVYRTRINRSEDQSTTMEPPVLSAGVYCVQAEALGPNCQIEVGGAAILEYPMHDSVLLVLGPLPAPTWDCDAEEVCHQGSCIRDCPEGLANCDDDPTNGCEANLNADNDNCGRCARACLRFPTQTECCEGQCCLGGCGDPMQCIPL